ncbi:MAG: PAS domain-containing protein [bacterium]|nr:PAS domain-containing protein [bacterium]
MKTIKSAEFIKQLGKGSWTYIKTIVDISREPILVLDKYLRVIVANEPFYQMFKVKPKDTEGQIIHKLGNGQWNIPVLQKLLGDILPRNTFFKGFEVVHEFPIIGRQTIILNARRIYCGKNAVSRLCSPIILLAMENVTEIMGIAETFTNYVEKLKREVYDLKKNT